jgi:dihydroxyacetone kinase-like protein
MSNSIFEMIHAVGNAVITHKEFLTELDQAIGDGDHGINMARGFSSVFSKLEAIGEEKDIAAIVKTIGMALISNVGGASGPLYGTAFLRAAGLCQGKNALDGELAETMFAAAINGIKERGKAVRGEKTMLDAMEPAYDAFHAARESGRDMLQCLEAALAAAGQGVEYTKTIIATKGRASYLGERSIGHQDPGATSFYIMLQALTAYYKS